MSKGASWALLSVQLVLSLLVMTSKPNWITDENTFLRDFIDQDILAFLGVILALALGLLAQLFLAISRLRDSLGEEPVQRIHTEIRSTAKALVVAYFISMIAVLAKGVVPQRDVFIGGINSIALLIISFYLLILYDTVMSVFDFDI